MRANVDDILFWIGIVSIIVALIGGVWGVIEQHLAIKIGATGLILLLIVALIT